MMMRPARVHAALKALEVLVINNGRNKAEVVAVGQVPTLISILKHAR